MYFQSYEDYMRNILGYPNNSDMCTYDNAQDYYTIGENLGEDRQNWYPDIYKIVYPMVCKVCNDNSSKVLTEELVQEMTEIVYRNVEEEKNTEIDIKTQARIASDRDTKSSKETEKRLDRNNYLKDLIRLLILGVTPGWRPPYRPPMPPRPPYPGGGYPPPYPGPGPQPRPPYPIRPNRPNIIEY